MFDNFILWFSQTDFYINYVSTWPAPLNNVSFDAFILLCFIIYGAWMIYMHIKSVRFHARLKDKQRQAEEAKADRKLRGVMTMKDFMEDEEFGDYLRFITVAQMQNMSALANISMSQFSQMKQEALAMNTIKPPAGLEQYANQPNQVPNFISQNSNPQSSQSSTNVQNVPNVYTPQPTHIQSEPVGQPATTINSADPFAGLDTKADAIPDYMKDVMQSTPPKVESLKAEPKPEKKDFDWSSVPDVRLGNNATPKSESIKEKQGETVDEKPEIKAEPAKEGTAETTNNVPDYLKDVIGTNDNATPTKTETPVEPVVDKSTPIVDLSAPTVDVSVPVVEKVSSIEAPPSFERPDMKYNTLLDDFSASNNEMLGAFSSVLNSVEFKNMQQKSYDQMNRAEKAAAQSRLNILNEESRRRRDGDSTKPRRK